MGPTGLPPAGWYPDPGAPSQQRYWDGEAWTNSTAPGAAAPTSPAPPAVPAVPAVPAGPVGPSAPGGPPGPPHATTWPTHVPGHQADHGWQGSPPTGANAAHYERAFAQFDAGGSKVHWNWAAFLLGAFWYLFRGMWAKAIGLVAVALISGGVLWLPLAIYTGLMGTYDCYLLQRRGTQGW